MDIVPSDDEEGHELEFFDARSTAGQSDSTFFSARNHGSSRNSCSAAASNADAGSVVGCNFTSRAADPSLDDPSAYQTESDAVTDGMQEAADLQGCNIEDCEAPEAAMADAHQPSLLAAFIGLDLAARMNHRRRSLHGALDDETAPAEVPFLGSEPAAGAQAEAPSCFGSDPAAPTEAEEDAPTFDLIARMNRLHDQAPHIAYTSSSGFGAAAAAAGSSSSSSVEPQAEAAAQPAMSDPAICDDRAHRVTDDTIPEDAGAVATTVAAAVQTPLVKAAPLPDRDDDDDDTADDARDSSFGDQEGKKKAAKLAASSKTNELLTKGKSATGGVSTETLSLLLELSPPPALLRSHIVAYDIAIAPLPPQQVNSPRQQLQGSPRPPQLPTNSPRTGGGPLAAASPRTGNLQRSALAAPSLHTVGRDSVACPEDCLEAAMSMMAEGSAAAFAEEEGAKAAAGGHPANVDAAAIDLLIQDLLAVTVGAASAADAASSSSTTKRSSAALQEGAPEPVAVAEVEAAGTPSPPAKRAFRTVKGLVVKLVPGYTGSDTAAAAAAPACSGTGPLQSETAASALQVDDVDLDAAIAAELRDGKGDCNDDDDGPAATEALYEEDDGDLAGGGADGLLPCSSAMRKRKAELTVFPEDEGHWAPDAPGMRLALDLDLEGATDAPPAEDAVVAALPAVKQAATKQQQLTEAKDADATHLPAKEEAAPLQEESSIEVKPAAAEQQQRRESAPSLPQQQQQVEVNGAVVQVVVVRGAAVKPDVEPAVVATAPTTATASGALPAESSKRRAAGFFKQLFKGCIYPSGQKWETAEPQGV